MDILKCLKEKKVQLEDELNKGFNHEDDIKAEVATFEETIRKQYKDADEKVLFKLTAQIEVVDELIEKQTQNLSADADTEQNEYCVATNEVTEQGE